MYRDNTDGNVHSDFGQLTLTYWVTPEKYNLNPDSGGLLLYDVMRGEQQSIKDYLSAGAAAKAYVDKHAKQAPIAIAYKQNKAIIFNPRIYHKSNQPQFDIANPSRARINLTFSFHNPAIAAEELASLNNN